MYKENKGSETSNTSYSKFNFVRTSFSAEELKIKMIERHKSNICNTQYRLFC